MHAHYPRLRSEYFEFGEILDPHSIAEEKGEEEEKQHNTEVVYPHSLLTGTPLPVSESASAAGTRGWRLLIVHDIKKLHKSGLLPSPREAKQYVVFFFCFA